MKKYVAIMRLVFKAQLSWRFDIACNMLYTFTRILFATVVWGVVFRTNDTVAGFTFQGMLSYYVISAFLAELSMTNSATDEIASSIREGGFTKYLVVPVHTEGYFFSKNIGASLFHAIFLLAAMLLSMALFGISLTLTPDPRVLFGALLMELLGLLFITQLNFFIGILAFALQNVWLLNMIRQNLTAFATGAIVPLALLPEAVLAVLRFLPFYYVTYLPTMLLIGREAGPIAPGLLILSGWIALFWLLNRVCYEALRRKYDGVGV